MSHLKRQEVPKSWPIKRKGTAYVVKSELGLEKGVPLLIFLRDMLKVCSNRKEAKRAVHLKQIVINGRLARDEKNGVTLFDKVSFPEAKKHYSLGISINGKYIANEVSEKDAKTKVAKIIGKKILPGKKLQINFSDGRNFLSKDSCNMGDSAVINFSEKKIEKCLPLQKHAKIIVYDGKHLGKTGIIEEVQKDKKTAVIKSEGKTIHVLIKQIMVIE